MRGLRWCLLVAAAAWPLGHAASLDDALTGLRRDWEVARYQTPALERERHFEWLAQKAHQLAETYPQRSEPLVLEGLALDAWAGEKNLFSALGLYRQARRAFEQAIRLDARTLDGAALVGLGELYLHAPPWPLAFGDKAQAGDWLQQALALDPAGLDSNVGWADYLVATGRAPEAVAHLQRALEAPLRPGRQVADTGRREEARRLLERARAAR